MTDSTLEPIIQASARQWALAELARECPQRFVELFDAEATVHGVAAGQERALAQLAREYKGFFNTLYEQRLTARQTAVS